MASNATATKSAKTPKAKKPPRQPPSDTVWLRYHPWMEGLMGHLASWAIHMLVIGGVLIWCGFLVYYFGFAKPPRSLPVEAVQFDAGGGGNPNGSGDDRGGHAPLQEGAQADKNNAGNTTNPAPIPDRPALPDDIAKRVDQEFSQDTARVIKQGPEAMQSFAALDKDIRDKLRDGLNPSQGQSGPGKNGGNGPGAGPGDGPGAGGPGKGKILTEREQRMLRWSLNFKWRFGTEYLEQLAGLGAILAIPEGPGSYKIVDLSKRPYHMEDRDLSSINRIWWIDEKPASVAALMQAMGFQGQPPRIVAFIPPELEDDLAAKETAFKGLKKEQIYETKFEVFHSGSKYDVRVFEQIPKP